MFIDTHAHLYADAFASDREAMIARATAAGIDKMLLPNIDVASIDAMLALEAAYPGRCVAMMGLHPCSVGPNYRADLAVMRSWLERRPFCAVGEIGIDLYWDKTYLAEQKEAFREQAGWGIELGLPLVIHSRESTDLLIELLKELHDPRLRGVFHCFTGTRAQAETIIGLGFHLGLGGVVTYKNGGLDQVVPHLPLEWLLLETDAPYLAPVPHRGKRNESAYVRLVADKVAEWQGITPEMVGRQTSRNATKLFGLPEEL